MFFARRYSQSCYAQWTVRVRNDDHKRLANMKEINNEKYADSNSGITSFSSGSKDDFGRQ
jgi:hypothetical protein